MTHHRSPGRRDAGSAYVMTLLALVVLTILALALAMVTQTEVQIGANEKTVNRSFYASDSGLGIAAAEALTSGRYNGVTVILNKTTVGNQSLADRVTTSAFVPLTLAPCDWCPVNEDGAPKYFKIDFAVAATAQRIGWSSSADPPSDPAKITLLGQKTLSAMFHFEPWSSPPVESVPTDPAALALLSGK
jgi:hypothetical protein